MKRLHVLLLSVLLLSAWQPAWALPPLSGPASPVISEIQTQFSETEKSREFVELYNPTDLAVDLEGWQIEYKSASGSSWTKKAELSGKIQPRGFYLAATAGYLDYADQVLTSGLSKAGGHIRLVKNLPEPESASETIDMVGWGTAATPEGDPAPAQTEEPNQSIKRIFSFEGLIQDSGDNAADFILSNEASPSSTPPPPLEEETELPPEEEEEEGEEEVPVYLPVEITELLVDPVEPASDATGEFIELYNPNEVPLELFGYVLKSGSNLQTAQPFGEIVLAPHEYRAFYSEDIALSLPNSGGRAELLDPAGSVISELVVFSKAPAGESWARVTGEWLWTDRVTPGAANEARQTTATPPNTPPVVAAAARSFARVAITELLPNPKSPQTDADDEFVELHNPHAYPVSLEGYMLETGSNLKTRDLLSGVSLGPGEFRAFFSSDTKISLSNSGGSARLLDPAGNVVAAVDPYPKAADGDAWALIGDTWQWTVRPTPAAKNLAQAPAPPASARAKGASARKSALPDIRQPAAVPAMIDPPPASSALVATAATTAVLYGLYEFRYDLRNRIELLRRYLSRRRPDR